MLQQGRMVRARMDYILGTDCRMFQNVSNQDPRHNTNHYMVLGCLRTDAYRDHQNYLGRHMRLPIHTP